MKFMDLGGKVLINAFNDISEFPSIFKKFNFQFKLIYSVTVNVLDEDEIFKTIIIVRNESGLKNLYKIMTLIKTDNLEKYGKPLITRKELMNLSSGLLIGTNITDGELSRCDYTNTNELIIKAMYYDFIIVDDLKNDVYLEKVIPLLDENKKLVVYPLEMMINDETIEHIDTLIDAKNKLYFLNYNLASVIVEENTALLSNMIEDVSIIKSEKHLPFIENSKEEINYQVFNHAHSIYGSNLPENIKYRLENELKMIIEKNSETVFLITKRLVDYSKELGYDIISRGGVGSSLVCYCLGLTKVDPLKYNLSYEKFLNNVNLRLDINYASVIYHKIKEYLENMFPNHVYDVGVMCERNGKKFLGKHASSLVIIPSNFEIEDFTPLAYIQDNKNLGYATVYNHYDLNNLMIINILGHTLPTTLQNLKSISNIDFDSLTYKEKEVYELFSSGNTDGIFGFDGPNEKEVLKKVKPKNFDELVNALIQVRNGKNIDKSHYISLMIEIYKLAYAKIHDFPSFIKCIEENTL